MKCNIYKHLKILKLVLFIFSVAFIYAQKNEEFYYYLITKDLNDHLQRSSSDTCHIFHVNQLDKTFYIGCCWDFQDDLPEIVSITSNGKIRFKNDTLYCYDKKLRRTYKFKYTNSYTIETLNHTKDFLKGMRLYLHVQQSENTYFRALVSNKDLFRLNYWKSGIRNGVFYWRNNECHKYIYFKNNIALDSVITSVSDKDAVVKIQNFMKLYSN